MRLAQEVASRATCSRKHVGAVLVRDRRIIATGYNGSVPGSPHCDDAGHVMVDGHCVRTVHAEANAIVQCARYGVSPVGATLYCTAYPCWQCAKLILSAGIQEIVFPDEYNPDPLVGQTASMLGVTIRRLFDEPA